MQVKCEQLTKQVAKAIKRERLKVGITQEALAEKAGLNYKFYQRVESGKSNLTLKTLYKVSKVLKVKPKAFFS